jgi:hypothetical protein
LFVSIHCRCHNNAFLRNNLTGRVGQWLSKPKESENIWLAGKPAKIGGCWLDFGEIWANNFLTSGKMSILLIISLLVVAILIVSFIGLIVFVHVGIHSKPAPGTLPPRPSSKCPACGCEEFDVYYSGFWDGRDSAGHGIGGLHMLGTCKSCGAHCDFYDWWDWDKKAKQYECHVLTEEEWLQRIEPGERWKRQRENWPFISKD